MPNLFLNGRFLAAQPTGVQRVAEELIMALSQKIKSDPDIRSLLSGEILHPRNITRHMNTPAFKERQIGQFTGQVWEQIDLARASGQTLLLNFCNVSPVMARNSVTMIHDAQVFLTPESYSRAFRTLYQTLLPAIGKRARRILTVSDYSKQQLADFKIADAERISVVHNGVDHIDRVEADTAILSKLKVKPRGYYVGLANTQAHKNLKVVIEAFQRPDMSDQRLVLFGGATGNDFHAKGIEVPDNVIFAGFVDDEEMRTLLEQASAIVFPSLTEGFGLPPLEAMYLGTPAICAPCGALPEVCADAAIYADPYDAEAWTRAMLTLANDTPDSWSNRSAMVRQHAGQFTWAAAADKLIEEIRPLL